MMIHELRPDVVIEIGTKFGGSALMFADMMDAMDHGRIISFDKNLSHVHEKVREHRRVTLIEASAGDYTPLQFGQSILIVEDAAHTYDCTRKCLELYSPLVQPGGYYVVEDAMQCHAHNKGERGPLEAIHDFLAEHPDWEMDRDREVYVMTSCAQGFLRRKA